MAHVVLGTKILRDGGIPEPIVEFAYTHHGTQVVEFFWHKCREQGNPKGLTEDHFRYPGMKPQTKETAILMLVDSIEAASRTIDPPERDKFEAMIQRIVFTKLKSGQLDDCGLTLEDLRILSTRMADTLVNAHHSRIKYPWQKQPEPPPALPTPMLPPAPPSEPAPEPADPPSTPAGGGSRLPPHVHHPRRLAAAPRPAADRGRQPRRIPRPAGPPPRRDRARPPRRHRPRKRRQLAGRHRRRPLCRPHQPAHRAAAAPRPPARAAMSSSAPCARGSLDRALALVASLDPSLYNPFNLLLGDASRLFVACSWAGPRMELEELPPGLHTLANDRIGSPLYPKTRRLEGLVRPHLAGPWAELRPALARALADHQLPPPGPECPVCDEELRPEARLLQALCVHTERRYGTRSAAILSFSPAGLASYDFADGRPCEAPFAAV